MYSAPYSFLGVKITSGFLWIQAFLTMMEEMGKNIGSNDAIGTAL